MKTPISFSFAKEIKKSPVTDGGGAHKCPPTTGRRRFQLKIKGFSCPSPLFSLKTVMHMGDGQGHLQVPDTRASPAYPRSPHPKIPRYPGGLFPGCSDWGPLWGIVTTDSLDLIIFKKLVDVDAICVHNIKMRSGISSKLKERKIMENSKTTTELEDYIATLTAGESTDREIADFLEDGEALGALSFEVTQDEVEELHEFYSQRIR